MTDNLNRNEDGTVSGENSFQEKSHFDEWIIKMDTLLDGTSLDKESAYHAMIDQKEMYLNNADFMWRLAKAANQYGIIIKSRDGHDEAKKLIFDASSYGEKAVELDNENPDAHKWYAISLGSVRDYNSIEEKIFNGHMIKMHCDQAMVSKPLDPVLIHLQGRWRYEISMFTSEENNLAARMFCIPPYSTFDEAESLLLKADELKPDWKQNLLYLAKTYIAKQELNKAIPLICRGVELPTNNETDIIPHQELQILQEKVLKSSK